jgi:hypothetical protein
MFEKDNNLIKLRTFFHDYEDKRNTWALNDEILQYSGFIIWNDTQKIAEIESLVFFKSRDFDQSSINCFIKTNNTALNASVIEIIKMEDNGNDLFKVKCHLKIPDYLISHLKASKIAILNSKKIVNQTSKFQKPSFINQTVTKKNSIMNCVHTVRNIS